MGGPRVMPKAERLIVSLWMSLRKEIGEPTAKQVLAAAEAYIKANNRRDILLPKIRKVGLIIKAAREQSRGLSPEEALMQKPWSMATLDEYPLPPETLPAVANAWRYAFITGEIFTIRQAKWASRIFPFQQDITKLWLSSYEYAKKEEASILSQRPFDTFNDDLRQLFSTIEVVTIWKTIHGDRPFPDPFSTSIPYANDGGIMHEVLHPVDYYNALYNSTVTNDRDKELHKLIAELPSFDSLGLISNELRIVYLIWVTHIKNMQEWQKISAQEGAEVVKKLREWALKQQAIKYGLEEESKDRIAARIKDNQVFIEDLPMPDEVLNLLSEYSNKEAKQ